MRIIRDKLAPGMVLESGAIDRLGRMLIGPGIELTEKLIKVIDNAQMPILYVTDESWEANKTCSEPPALSPEDEERLQEHFMHVDLEGPFARAVYDECHNMARERVAKGEPALSEEPN